MLTAGSRGTGNYSSLGPWNDIGTALVSPPPAQGLWDCESHTRRLVISLGTFFTLQRSGDGGGQRPLRSRSVVHCFMYLILIVRTLCVARDTCELQICGLDGGLEESTCGVGGRAPGQCDLQPGRILAGQTVGPGGFIWPQWPDTYVLSVLSVL